MSARPAPPVSGAVRVTTVAAVVVVALVAAVVSYAHMQELANRAGEGWRSWLIPASVDGLIVAASMVLLVRRRAGLPGGWLAWTALLGGVGASLACNIAAAQPELTARLLAAWPPLAFAAAFELLLQQRRPTAAPDAAQPGRVADRHGHGGVVPRGSEPAPVSSPAADRVGSGGLAAGAAPVRPLVPLVPASAPGPAARPADPPAARPGFNPAVDPGNDPTGQPPDRSGGSDRADSAGRNGPPDKRPERPKTDAQLSAAIRRMAHRDGGQLPTTYAVRQALGIGASRAERLLAELNTTTPVGDPNHNGATRR